METRDISLAGRILAAFDLAPDALAELGALAKRPRDRIVKLQRLGLDPPAQVAIGLRTGPRRPDYPDNPTSNERRRPCGL